VLVAICMGMLAAAGPAGAAGPVVGALDPLGATAKQQLAAVAHSATSAPAAAVPPVTDVATRALDAVPQASAAATTTVHTTADSTIERTGEPGPSDAGSPSGLGEHAPPSASPPDLPAAVRQTERAIAGTAHVPAVIDRAVPLRAMRKASAAGSSRSPVRVVHTLVHIDTLVHAVTGTPATHELRQNTAALAGALLGAGVIAKTSAGLVTLPLSGPASPLGPVTISKTPELIPGDASRPSLPIGAQDTPSALSSSATAPTVALASTALGASAFGPISSAPVPRRLPAAGRIATRAPATSARLAPHSGAADGADGRPLPARATSSAPVPGGISVVSGSGATGGLGAATSLALLALLLLLVLPPAFRRLRLAGESLRAAQFVLIPERPG
jgi:hypothetical protein